MNIALQMDVHGLAIVSDGLHRVILDAEVVRTLAEKYVLLQATGGVSMSDLTATIEGRGLRVIPLPAEVTAQEAAVGVTDA